MTATLLFLLLAIAANTATAATCGEGKSIVENVDDEEVVSDWKAAFLNNDAALEKYSCFSDQVVILSDGEVSVSVNLTRQSDQKRIYFSGTFQKVNSNTFKETFYDGEWDSEYTVLAIKPGRYRIISGCPEVGNGKPLVAIMLTTWTLDEELLNEIKSVLVKTGLKFEDFKPFCHLVKTV